MFRATFLNYDYFLDYTKAAYAHTTSSTLPTRTQPVYNYLVEIYQYLTVSELDNLKHYKTPFIHYMTVVILMRVRVNRTCQNDVQKYKGRLTFIIQLCKDEEDLGSAIYLKIYFIG